MTDNPPTGFDPESIIPPPFKEWEGPVTAIALDLSGTCNLRCRYCAEAATQPERKAMTEEMLEKAWEFLFPDGKPREGYTARLGSGEPLLSLPLMKKMARLQPPAVLAVTTNGTLIDDEAVEFLIESGWSVKISIDGPKHIHDAWRVTRGGQGTYDIISKRVIEFAKRIPDRFSVTAVLCRGTDPAEVFDGLEKLGVRRIELVHAVNQNESILPGEEEIELYRKFLDKYVKRWLSGEDNPKPAVLIGFGTFVQRVMGYKLYRVACAAGRSFVGIAPNGDLYPCFRFIGVEKYKLGNLSTGLDREAVKTFAEGAGRPYEKRESCVKCWAAPICSGPCFACSEMFGPGDGKPDALACKYILADAEAAVHLVNELREQDPERLLSFLPSVNLDHINFDEPVFVKDSSEPF